MNSKYTPPIYIPVTDGMLMEKVRLFEVPAKEGN